jgi:hypothetical protein
MIGAQYPGRILSGDTRVNKPDFSASLPSIFCMPAVVSGVFRRDLLSYVEVCIRLVS